MKNINLKIDLKSIIGLIKGNVAIVLWLVIILITVAEVFVLKNSVGQFFASTDDSIFGNAQITRINFNQYENIENLIIENTSFIPEPADSSNPFGQSGVSTN